MLSDDLLTVAPETPAWRKEAEKWVVCVAVFTGLALAAILYWPAFLEEAPVAPAQMTSNADLKAIQKLYDYVGAGKLQGPSCIEAAKEIAIDDVVLDTTSDAMPHLSGARFYYGPKGICEFSEFLSTFRQPDYTLAYMLHDGRGTVVIKESLTPTVIATGKTTDHPLDNMVEYKVKEGKVSHMKGAMAFLPRRRLIRAGRPIGLTLLLAAAACWQTAWLLPQTAGKAPGASRRSALLGAAAAALAAPSSVRAFGDVKMPMSNVRWKEVQCNPDKGEMLKGTRATYGLEPRCVEVTAQVTNPEEKVLKKAGVFGKVNNIEEQTSVLANAMDGASDNGQFTLIEEIPPGTSDVVFRFVAALPKKYNNGPLPNLEFFQLKASWYPGAVRWQPLSECDLNPTADGCEEAERFCKNCQNNLSADGKPIYS